MLPFPYILMRKSGDIDVLTAQRHRAMHVSGPKAHANSDQVSMACKAGSDWRSNRWGYGLLGRRLGPREGVLRGYGRQRVRRWSANTNTETCITLSAIIALYLLSARNARMGGYTSEVHDGGLHAWI
jgi:hypothetical protein